MAQDATPPAAELGAARLGAAAGRPWPSVRTQVAFGAAWRATLLSRVLVWAAGMAAVLLWPPDGGARFDPQGLTDRFGAVGNVLLAPAARWDATWFTTIAVDGYGRDTARPAFFPLYPLTMKAGSVVTGSALIAGVLISLVAMLVALTLLHRLTDLELGAPAARMAVWLTALFPMAFALSAVYSESLFLALAVGCLLAARTDRWALAGLLGGLAAATRSAGVLLLVALALLFWDQWRTGPRPAPARVLWLGLVPLGPALICAWFAARGLDPLSPFHAQATWYREFAGPFGGVWDGAVAAFDGARQLLSGSRTPVYFTAAGGDPFAVAGHNLMPFAFLLLAVPAVVGVLRRLPIAYGAYTIAALALPLSYPVGPQPLMSLPRFLAVLFPLFMWGGAWTARGGRRRAAIVLGLSAAGLVVFTAQFATWRWVA